MGRKITLSVKKLLLAVFIIVAMLLTIQPIFIEAASVHGEVYDYRLSKLEDVIVFVDSQPVQRYIVKNNTYFFELAPGTYTLTARTFGERSEILGTDEIIEVNKEGSFVFDIVLTPIQPEQTVIKTGTNKLGFFVEYQKVSRYVNIAAGIIILAALSYAIYKIYNKIKKRKLKKAKQEEKEEKTADDNKGINAKKENKSYIKKEEKKTKEKKVELKKKDNQKKDEEAEKINNEQNKKQGTIENKEEIHPDDETAKAVLDLIKKEKRITQKDIRKLMPDSEAKISLVISELESKGIIKKIKKGRGNIIIYSK